MKLRKSSTACLTSNASQRHSLFRLLCFAAITLLVGQFSSHAAVLPEGFSTTHVASGFVNPTTMAFAPDGRLFVCEQGGRVRVIKDGALLPTPFVSLAVDATGERGLLGIAFDPNFSTNHYVYLYYTVNTDPRHNRVSRFTADGDVASPGSENLILRLDDLGATTHNGGALNFGPDGKLYISVGDNVRGVVAQSLDNLLGKILRINTDGTIPTDNPFYNSATGNRRAIWARGLRNPFSFAIHPVTGRMYINDVGEQTWEEVNEGLAGANYGWPSCEGNCANPNFRNPVYAYPHGGTGCDSIAGGAFYNPPVNQFPQQYVGKYFFADWCQSWIKVLNPVTNEVTDFGVGEAWGLVDLDVGPDGSLYYVLWSYGVVFKIQYTSNLAPAISTHPSSQTVSEGLAATFSVTASGAQPLSYQWQRNGAPIQGATSGSYTLNSATLADNGAKFRVVVTNANGSVTSNEATLTVTPNKHPAGTITSPAEGTTYRAGDTISYAGAASDAEDGVLPPSAFTWRVDFHHETHFHPFIPSTSGSAGGSFIIPTEGETSSDVWYRIHLTVTDSRGLTHASYRDVLPKKSNITLATNPAGLQVTLDGQPLTAPFTITSVVGTKRTLGVITPQVAGGVTYDFSSWSDGGAATHSISTPAAATTYTAFFVPRQARLQFSSSSYSVAEGAGNVQITVTRTTSSAGAVSVAYATGSGTATAGVDYTASSGILNFADGEISKTFTVAIKDDLFDETDETINVSLGVTTGGAQLGEPGTAVITVSDNDQPPSVSIGDANVMEGNSGASIHAFNATLSAPSGKIVTVNYATANHTAIAPADYTATTGTLTFNPGETTKSITVAIVGDTTGEGNEQFFINLSNPTNATLGDAQGIWTILDDEAGVLQFERSDFFTIEGAGEATITVLRTNGAAGAVTIAYATSDGSATAASDYAARSGTLNFANGETVKTFKVPILDDSVFETDETIRLTLSNPTGGALLSSPLNAVLTISDNESQPTLSVRDFVIAEGNAGTTEATFTVDLSGVSTREVRANFITSNGTAVANADYLSKAGQIVFLPGETVKTVNVTIIGDILPEEQETFFVTLSAPVNASIARAQASGTILDNRSPLLLKEDGTNRAVALDSVTMMRDPFSVLSTLNFSADGRTRIALFVANARLLPGDAPSVVTVMAKDSEQRTYPLMVEYVGKVPLFDWLTQIVVKLPDQILKGGDYNLTVEIRGERSNAALINIKP